jgi:hypothetical protein
MDYTWTRQMDNKIIALGPATYSTTRSPAWHCRANPSLRLLFWLHWAISIVPYRSEFIEITFRSFVRPFPGDSPNTATIVIVAMNVYVIQIILGLIVKPPIDQRDSHPEGRSATTHIHNWTGHFSFWIKSCILKIFVPAHNHLMSWPTDRVGNDRRLYLS